MHGNKSHDVFIGKQNMREECRSKVIIHACGMEVKFILHANKGVQTMGEHKETSDNANRTRSTRLSNVVLFFVEIRLLIYFHFLSL